MAAARTATREAITPEGDNTGDDDACRIRKYASAPPASSTNSIANRKKILLTDLNFKLKQWNFKFNFQVEVATWNLNLKRRGGCFA